MPYRGPTPLRRRLERILFTAIALALLSYPADWLIWWVRTLAGGGMGTVTVNTLTAATLKGNHFEVYSSDTAPASCSRSLFPQAGAGACWWLRRHPQQVNQY